MSGYIGAQPVPQATQHREAFTATASQTSFPTAGYTPQFVDVYLNGIKLAAEDYTATNGSDIVLTTGAALDDILEYVAYTPFEVASQTFTGTTTVDVLDVTGAVTPASMNWSAATRTRPTIQAIPNATATIIAYDTLVYDNLGELDATGRFTADVAGKYHISASVLMAQISYVTGTYVILYAYKNGSGYAVGDYWLSQVTHTGYGRSSVNVDVDLAAGDYIDIRVLHNRGSGLDTLASAQYNQFSIHRVS